MRSGRWLLALVPSLSERHHEPAKDIWEGRDGSLGRKPALAAMRQGKAAENEAANHENHQLVSSRIKSYG